MHRHRLPIYTHFKHCIFKRRLLHCEEVNDVDWREMFWPLHSVGLQACRMLCDLSRSTNHVTMIFVGIELFFAFLSVTQHLLRTFDLVPSSFCHCLIYFQSLNADWIFPMKSGLRIQQEIKLPLALKYLGLIRAAETIIYIFICRMMLDDPKVM